MNRLTIDPFPATRLTTIFTAVFTTRAGLRQRVCMAAVFAAAALQGCALPGAPANAPAAAAPAAVRPVAKAAPAPVTPEPTPAPAVDSPEVIAQQAVTAGVDAYNRGEYAAAIRKLTAPEVAAGEKSQQLIALKYAAFSYCLTKRQTQCRHEFERAFKLDPAFDLAPGEKGHPLWTPAFEAAKRATHPKKLKR